EPLPRINISGLPRSPAATTATKMTRVTAVSAIRKSWSKLKPHAGRARNEGRPRQARKNNHPITTKAAGKGTWVSPIARSIHSNDRSGEVEIRPSTHAAINAETRMLQNLTAGPRRGPRVQRIHRSSGTRMEVSRFALGTGRRTCSAAEKSPSALLIFHPTDTDC